MDAPGEGSRMTGAPGHIPDVSDGEGPMLAAGKMVGRYRLLSLVASGGSDR